MTTIYYDAIMGLKQEMSWHCTMNPVEIENTGIRRQVIKEITDFAKKYDVKKFFSSDQGKR